MLGNDVGLSFQTLGRHRIWPPQSRKMAAIIPGRDGTFLLWVPITTVICSGGLRGVRCGLMSWAGWWSRAGGRFLNIMAMRSWGRCGKTEVGGQTLAGSGRNLCELFGKRLEVEIHQFSQAVFRFF